MVTGVSSLRALAGVTEESLTLLIKSWRGAGYSDAEIVRKLRDEIFAAQPGIQGAISKALAAPAAQVAPDKRVAIDKAVGQSTTLRGAVASAFARTGFAVEKGFDGPTADERIAKARKHLDVSYSPGSREAIKAKARELGTEI
jgi:hypothetical protein